MKDRWPYTDAMRRARKRREFRKWLDEKFPSDTVMTIVFVTLFLIMLALHIWSPYR